MFLLLVYSLTVAIRTGDHGLHCILLMQRCRVYVAVKRPSVRLSVRLSVCPIDRQHQRWPVGSLLTAEPPPAGNIIDSSAEKYTQAAAAFLTLDKPPCISSHLAKN